MKAFKLITLDLDHTLFLGNSVIYLNGVLGISKLLERYHADYSDAKISELELNTLQTPILEKISVSKALDLLSNGPFLKNLDKGVRMLRSAGANVQMLTMNPLQIVFQKRYGIGTDISLFTIHKDRFNLSGTLPENKVELLERYCLDSKLEMASCAHVGDSKNDVETFRRVGYSIALNSNDEKVQNEADASLKTDDFLDVTNTLLRADDLA